MSERSMLEILLENADLDCDAETLAERLLSRFEALPSVLGATRSQLLETEGVTEELAIYLSMLGAMHRREHIRGLDILYPEYYEEESFQEFLLAKLDNTMALRVYPMDGDFRILARCTFPFDIQNGVFPSDSEVLKAVEKYAPTAVALAYSGTVLPMVKEEAKRLSKRFCHIHGVQFCDWVVYSKEGIFYDRENGEEV